MCYCKSVQGSGTAAYTVAPAPRDRSSYPEKRGLRSTSNKEYKMLLKVVSTVTALALLFLIWGSIGGSDYAEMISQENHYCQQVHDHVWPDYKKSYHRDCKDGKYVTRN